MVETKAADLAIGRSVAEMHTELRSLWEKLSSATAAMNLWGNAYYAACGPNKPELFFEAGMWLDSQIDEPKRIRLTELPKETFEQLCNLATAQVAENYVQGWQEVAEISAAGLALCAAIVERVANTKTDAPKAAPG